MLSPKGDSTGRLAKILTVCFCLLTLIVLFRLVGAVLLPQGAGHNIPLLAPCDNAQPSSLGGADSSSALAGVDAKVSQVLQILQANPALPAGAQAGTPAGGKEAADMIDRYLTLMATTLTGIVYRRPVFGAYGGTKDVPLEKVPFNEAAAVEGLVWPDVGHTMVGMKRLNNIRLLLETGGELMVSLNFFGLFTLGCFFTSLGFSICDLFTVIANMLPVGAMESG